MTIVVLAKQSATRWVCHQQHITNDS